MAKHTPCSCYVHVDTDPTRTRIVHCPLHAAASDLLEALKDLMTAFGGVTTHAQQEKWNKAKAAIAKAEVPEESQ